jgi:hypothetical protein
MTEPGIWMRKRGLFGMAILLVAPLLLGGCVQRLLTVRSKPPGALLYLNGVEIGRTPLTRDFVWYGTYAVELRKPGYQTLKTTGDVKAPWWQWVPIDFLTEFFPLRDHQHLGFTLTPQNPLAANPQTMLNHAEQLGSQLESSPFTRSHVTTAPSTRSSTRRSRPATTRAATAPATNP